MGLSIKNITFVELKRQKCTIVRRLNCENKIKNIIADIISILPEFVLIIHSLRNTFFLCQGFFKALCHNTIFVFKTEFVKGRRCEKINSGSGVAQRI